MSCFYREEKSNGTKKLIEICSDNKINVFFCILKENSEKHNR